MVTINGIKYEVKRFRFRKFIEMEELQEKITKHSPDMAELICDYVSKSLGISKEICLNETWKSIAVAYVAILTENIFALSIPFLKSKRQFHEEKLPWEYPGRLWFTYANLFSKHYGWTIDYIAELDIEDAMKLLQEILVDEQLRREWEWDLSEKSTGYDEATKKSKHINLPRPEWMIIVPPPPKLIRVKRSFLPAGVVIKLDGTHAELN